MSQSENSPLLRSVNTKSNLGRRMFGITLLGLLLLAVYQLVFLARTSASRDWDHLHGSKFTTPEAEREIIASISNSSIAEWTDHYYLSGPHLAGQNEALAEWTRAKFEEFGFDAKIETYEVLLNYPVDHSVSLLNGTSVVQKLSLEEEPLDEDPTTSAKDRIPTFHGYSASGNATGHLVYANYGRKRDYELLAQKGIDLRGKIVIARYGGIFRGLKVKFAEEHGAAGVLIYTDPYDDGQITKKNGYKTYPDGPARNPSSVQRGSVQDIGLSPGDPTTPGYASKPGVPREKPHGIPGIPSIPISYADALPLLESLNGWGPEFPEWKGGLDGIDYSVGPSKLQVNVYNEQDYQIRTIHNVIARIEGSIAQDVIVGNHRDAWVLGAADPNSGSSTLLELGRALGGLYQKGWKPYRSVVLASWDAEEYGLVGSTEWGEDHADYLSGHALAYINSDVAYAGHALEVSGSQLLSKLVHDSADITPADHAGFKSLGDYWAAQPGGREIAPLGSGSDYTVFQDHLAIPSLDIGFTSNASSPVYHYHSNYDSLHWQKTYGDPTFEYHATIGRFLGIAVAKLTGHAIIPFRITQYAKFVDSRLNKLLVDNEDDEAISDLLSVAHKFVKKAKKFDSRLDHYNKQYHKDFPWYQWHHKLALLFKIKVANLKLFEIERAFQHYDGLDGREWFKHLVYAPGRYTGYAGQVLPGISEALEDGDWDRLYKWVEITHNILHDVTITISS